MYSPCKNPQNRHKYPDLYIRPCGMNLTCHVHVHSMSTKVGPVSKHRILKEGKGKSIYEAQRGRDR